jgi:ribonuclease Z
MRLNLDKVTHPIHCYYPARGKKYFDRLRYGTIYHETIHVVEHPVHQSGLVEDDGKFRIEAVFLEHGVENIGWRITEPDTLKFDPAKLKAHQIGGPHVKELQSKGSLLVDGKEVRLEDVSWVRHGDSLAVVIDTRLCPQAVEIAKNARIMLCEATYLDEHKELAYDHMHLTAKQAAQIAKDAGAKELILTHFSARYQNLRAHELEAKAIFPNTHCAEDLKVFPFPKNEN